MQRIGLRQEANYLTKGEIPMGSRTVCLHSKDPHLRILNFPKPSPHCRQWQAARSRAISRWGKLVRTCRRPPAKTQSKSIHPMTLLSSRSNKIWEVRLALPKTIPSFKATDTLLMIQDSISMLVKDSTKVISQLRIWTLTKELSSLACKATLPTIIAWHRQSSPTWRTWLLRRE